MILSTLKEVVKYIGLLLICAVVMSIIALIFNIDISENVLYIGTFALFYIFVIIYLKRRKVNILDLCNFRKVTIKDAVFAIMLAIVFQFIVSAIGAILDSVDKIAPYIKEYENSMQNLIGSEKIEIVFFAIVIAAPFFEELMFRGLIFGTMLVNQMNIYLAAVLQALLFGLIHFDLYQGAVTFLMGIFSAFVLYCTNSIWNSIVFHAVFNFFGLNGLIYEINKSTESDLPIMGYIIMLVIGITLMYMPMRYFLKRKLEIKN
ncbi:CPBP family intramembrane glutamic endopeptidase [Anaerocellum danielii]|uniref:Type II CAAX endopeptidase family protein n=1 Tax=Anaerocellum danielii TaxID=1387557 RepID=A0ABZ0U011_9FIRM|nr:type II CAAX endopeptidase family protein [Caldicellulosiruptor danielii]WPX08995.1 type II CAAX endopeptidase family protein [Caldicellulosiruptor danielii]